MVIAAAGALSVATAASATAATWSQRTQGHADGPAEITPEASGAPRLTLTSDLAVTRQAAQPAQAPPPARAAQPARAAPPATGQSDATWAHEEATGWY
jgi:hypothetical protein